MDLFGKRVFVVVNKNLEMRSSGFDVGPKFNARYPYKRRAEGDQGHREKARRSEFCTFKQRCMWSHWKLEEARRFSHGAFEESTALLTR